jgi:putative transcriptional regulator
MIHERVENRVRELRLQLGLTQAQLAERAGVARVSIVSIETGRFLPTIETALHISHVLGAPVERIFWLKQEGT